MSATPIVLLAYARVGDAAPIPPGALGSAVSLATFAQQLDCLPPGRVGSLQACVQGAQAAPAADPRPDVVVVLVDPDGQSLEQAGALLAARGCPFEIFLSPAAAQAAAPRAPTPGGQAASFACLQRALARGGRVQLAAASAAAAAGAGAAAAGSVWPPALLQALRQPAAGSEHVCWLLAADGTVLPRPGTVSRAALPPLRLTAAQAAPLVATPSLLVLGQGAGLDAGRALQHSVAQQRLQPSRALWLRPAQAAQGPQMPAPWQACSYGPAQGWAEAAAHIIAREDAPLVAVLAAESPLRPDAFGRLVAALQQQPGAAFAFADDTPSGPGAPGALPASPLPRVAQAEALFLRRILPHLAAEAIHLLPADTPLPAVPPSLLVCRRELWHRAFAAQPGPAQAAPSMLWQQLRQGQLGRPRGIYVASPLSALWCPALLEARAVSALTAELAALRQLCAATAAERDALVAAEAQQRAALAAAAARARVLAAAAAAQQAAQAQAQDQAQAALAELMDSASWRLTRPARRLFSRLQAAQQRLAAAPYVLGGGSPRP